MGESNHILSYEKESILQVPEELCIELTNRCNLSCDFCFNPELQKKDIPLDDVLDIIAQASQAGVKTVRLTGGEPLLHPDIKKILITLKDKGFYVILNTNALLLNDKNIDNLKYVDDILLSIHFIKRIEELSEIISRTRKHTHAWIRACTILTAENIELIAEFYDGVKNIDINDWFFLRQMPTQKNPAPVSRVDMLHAMHKIRELNLQLQQSGSHLHPLIRNSVPFCIGEKKDMAQVCIGGRNDSGHTRLIIDSSGNYKSAYYSQKLLGNIKADDIKDVWNSSYLLSVRNYDRVPLPCKTCRYLSRCKGGIVDEVDFGPDYLIK